MLKAKARFIGKDSLGYITYNMYTINIKQNIINREDGSGTCPYGSVEAFLKNWVIMYYIDEN